MADGKVVIETDLDASGIKAGLSKLSGIAQSGIKGTLTAIASAGTALAGLGGAAIKIGADFEEGMSEVQAISRASASDMELLKEKAKEMADKLPQIPKSPSNHFENFLLACNGIEKTRSPFEINGVLSQVFSLGVMAQRLNTQLFFDSRTKQITNNEFANAMLTGIPPRKGWDEFYKL